MRSPGFTALLLAIGLLGAGDGAHADTRGIDDALYYIDNADGLPQNSVRALLVDHQNFVWVGTERGLARFDGHRFVNFSDRLEQLPVDVLINAYEDSHGRIWTNWYKSNPTVLSADRGSALELTPAFPDESLVEWVDQLYEDRQGRVWFGGTHSINWLAPDGTRHALRTPTPADAFLAGSGGVVFVATRGGLYHVDSNADEPSVAFLDFAPGGPDRAGPAAETVHSLLTWDDRVVACTARGVYLVETAPVSSQRLYRPNRLNISECRILGDTLFLTHQPPGRFESSVAVFDLRERVFRDLPPGLPASGLLAHTYIDQEDNQWLVLDGEVYRRRPEQAAFERVPLRAPVFGQMATIAETRCGEIWIGTDGAGLAVLAPHRRKFDTLVPPNPGREVTSSQVRGMAVDHGGAVWLGTDERGINRLQRASGAWRQYRTDSGPFKELVVLGDGSLWVGDAPNQQLLRYDPAEDRFHTALELPANFLKLAPGPAGQLLIASGPALWALDPDSQSLRRLNRSNLPAPVRAMTLGPDGDIWFAMHNWGLSRLDQDGQMRQWTTTNSGLTSDQIFSLHFDDDGALWIGTWHGGLLRFDVDAETFTHWNSTNGLPDDTVFGVLPGGRGELWLSTYVGLLRFTPCMQAGCRPDTHVFNHFDGLQGDEFDADSAYRSPAGELFFGGAGGFNAFFPERIELNDHAPDLVITRASLDGLPVPGSGSVFDPPASIALPAGFGELRIRLSALDYNAPSRNRYQFRNRAADDRWSDLESPELVLRGLEEGRYLFEFRGSNNDGLWSSGTERLEVRVRPPWFRSPEMLLVYAALLLLGPILFYQLRQRRLVATRRLLERQVAQRTRELEQATTARERFFANVSHEIAAPLHMILMMLEQNRDREGSGGPLYRSATGYAAQLLVYLRHLVEGARSLEEDSRLYRVDIARTLRSFVDVNQAVAQGRRISLATGRLDAGHVKLFRHTPSSIFSNLLANALTYTPEGGVVRIEGAHRDDRYRVSVINSLSSDYAMELERMMQRGARGTFDATAFGGHGLGLSIVTESVESVGGRMDRCITPDGCIRFDIDLPLADPSLPDLPDIENVSFSREQQLAIERVHESEPEPGAGNAPLGAADETRPAGRRLLIVEDDSNVAVLMANGLRQHFQVRMAGNCQEGIRAVRDWLPEIILSDLFLPDAPGFELVRAVRENRMTQNALVLMVSASISEDDRETGIQLGVDQFIRKPVSIETLRLTIRNHFELGLQRHAGQRAAELRQRAMQQAGAPRGDAFKPGMEQALDELYADPSTTIEDLQTRLLLGYPALVRLCRKYFDSTPKRLLVERRIAEAKKLLRNTDHKIGLIAELSGFASHAQFATTFKRETGSSPAQYRRARSRR